MVRHGHAANRSMTPEYRTWLSMKNRCLNPNELSYKRYGGRGVTVCERWLVFECFLGDMGKRPSTRHSIDRIDTGGNYSKENCRWATPTEQCRNRRNNVLYDFRGKLRTAPEIAELIGMKADTVDSRLRSGWSIAEATTRPVRKSARWHPVVTPPKSES